MALPDYFDFLLQQRLTFIFLTMLTLYVLLSHLCSTPAKKLSKADPTNIMITGGVQGLGKALAIEFARRHEIGAVNFIILDIAENLAAGMIADMEKALGSKGR